MDDEMQSLQKNQTWNLTQLPKKNKTIGYKQVYEKKKGFPNKNGVYFKARLMAKGYSQRKELTSVKYFLQLLNILPLKFYWPWQCNLIWNQFNLI